VPPCNHPTKFTSILPYAPSFFGGFRATNPLFVGIADHRGVFGEEQITRDDDSRLHTGHTVTDRISFIGIPVVVAMSEALRVPDSVFARVLTPSVFRIEKLPGNSGDNPDKIR
jgi:hypothetical protein